jgi:hypothetical protein
MADIFFFIQQGWKIIWKQNTIWLFSLLVPLYEFLLVFPIKKEANSLWPFLSVAKGIISFALVYITFIAIPYIAYCYAIGKLVTIRETLIAVRKFSGRIIGCSCLGLLMISPFLCLEPVILRRYSTDSVQSSSFLLLVSLLTFVFDAMVPFSLAGFFANDWGIRQTLSEAWALYTDHFLILAVLGISVQIIFHINYAISAVLAVLIQSGFAVNSLSGLNYFNPNSTLSGNLLYLLISGIGLLIIAPLHQSIFMIAHLKYSDAKKID